MKTICIYHSRDLDGWMSAAIVKKWFLDNLSASDSYDLIEDNKKYEQARGRGDYQSLTFLGWDYGDPIPDLSAYDKIIMCDISFPKENMEAIEADFDNFIWIDHHISAININEDNTCDGIRDTKFAACELTWKHFFPNEKMPEIVRLLGRYDCFGHKGTDEEQKVLEFQYGARQVISNYEEAYSYLLNELKVSEEDRFDYVIRPILKSGKSIYQYLCSEAKGIYKRAFPIIFEFSTVPKVNEWTMKLQQGKIKYKFFCVNQPRFNPINFGIDYHKEGYVGFACFHYEKGKWMWSLYNDNGKIDCSVIAKQYGGGGHKGAAGFVQDELNLNF